MKLAIAGWCCAALVVGVVLVRAQEQAKVSAQTSARIPAKRDAGAAPVLVELFTSEGCSSCPPADRVLAELDRQGVVSGAPVIVMSEHVDYWDHLGWRDPFSSAQFSRRQEDYAGALGERGVYTPQMVVDGRAAFVGSDQGEARRAIARAVSERAVSERKVALQLRVREGVAIVAAEALPGEALPKGAELWLAITEGGLKSSVARGENGGRTLAHTGVVRRLTKLGATEMTQMKAPLQLDAAWKTSELRVVAFVQDRVSHRVLGAAMAKIAQ